MGSGWTEFSSEEGSLWSFLSLICLVLGIGSSKGAREEKGGTEVRDVLDLRDEGIWGAAEASGRCRRQTSILGILSHPGEKEKPVKRRQREGREDLDIVLTTCLDSIAHGTSLSVCSIRLG